MDEDLILTMHSRVHGMRTWRRTGMRDHVTRDGRKIILAVWESSCVVCGAPFQVAAPMRAASAEQSKSFLMTTCPAHRMTPSEVAKLRFAKAANRPAIFEALKGEKLSRGEHGADWRRRP